MMHTRHGRLVATLLATTALTTPGWAQNLPTGGAVAHGGVTIATPSASSMTINQSTSSAIVNWQGFSIGQGNRVDIIQPSSSSALLNRVTGSTPSTIAGQLNANGQVYLVNPNGIAITRSGTVNAGGFVGSTLGITDDDFKAGRARFTGNGNSATVSNAGTITIGRGGYAALLGGHVSNSGTIAVPQGRVGLGAGEAATLDFSGDGFLQVSVPSTSTRKGALIRHSGNISGNMVEMKAATARDAARRAINLSGVVEATSVGGRSGAIVLGGGPGGGVKVTGRLVAPGGKVKVTGQKVKVAGEVDVSGPQAGKIVIKATQQATVTGKLVATSSAGTGGNITVSSNTVSLLLATIEASGAFGGGNIRLGRSDQPQGAAAPTGTTTIDGGSTVRADAIQSGNGGTVIVTSADTTRSSGLITALGGPGGTGGEVQVLGQRVALENKAIVDVSGPAGGGTVLIGGDFQGKNPEIANAFQTFVGSHAKIRADAITVGDGGKVIVWANDWTKFYGNISARGGAESGNGGFAEVSGKENLTFMGRVNLSAPKGNVGTLLLDPRDITVIAGVGADDASQLPDKVILFGDGAAGTDFQIGNTALNASLTGANVLLQANRDIKFNAAIAPGAGTGALTLQAGRSIEVNESITLRGAFTATANDPGADATERGTGAAQFTMAAGKTISTATNSNDITIRMSTGPGGGGQSGNISLATLNAGAGHVLVANNGATAGSSIVRADATQLITANSAALDVSAAAGGSVGLVAAPIRLTVTNVAARGQSGGVFLDSTGTVNIGSATLGGLTGLSTPSGGNIALATSNGSITTSEAIAANGAGTVTLTAGGAGAITISNPVSSGSGAVQLTAAEGVTLNGSTGNVTTTGPYTVNADSNGAGAGTYTQNSAGSAVSSGAVSITAVDFDLVGTINSGAANVTLAPSTPGATIGVGAGAGTFAVSTAEIGRITTTGLLTIGSTANTGGIDARGPSAETKNIELVTAGAITVQTTPLGTTGTLTLSGNNITLNASAAGSSLTLRPTTPGTLINIGGADVAFGTLGLDATDIGNANTVGGFGILTIGRNDVGNAAGNISVTAATTQPGAPGRTLILRTGGSITQTAGSGITTTNLGLVAGPGGVDLQDAANAVTNISGLVTGTGTGNFVYSDANSPVTVINIPAVNGGSAGIQTTNGSVTLLGTGVTLASNLSTDNKGAASTVSISGPVTINAASVTIDTNSTAGNTAGNVTFANKIEGQAAGTNTLIVDARSTGTGGAVTFADTVGATTRLGGLAVAGASASLTGTNNVDNLAVALSGAGNGFTYTDANALTVSTVGGIVGVTTNSGAVSLTATGSLTVSNVVNTTGTGTTTLASTAGAVIAVNDTVGNANNTTTLTSNGAINGTGTVIGTSVTLDSAVGVGTGSGGRLATSADTLAARSTTSGGVFVSEANAVTLNTIGGVANGAAGGGAFDLTAGGAITVSGAVNTPGTGATTLLTSSGDIALGAGVGNASAATTLTAAGAITRSAGTVSGTTVTLSAATGIGSAAPVNTAATTISATNTTSGNIDILEANGVDIAGLTTSGGNGSIQLVTTNGSITTTGAISANGSGNVTLRAQGAGNTLVLNNPITSGTGNVILAGQNGVTLNGASADVTISATGTYTVDADSNSDGTGTYTQGGSGATVSAPGGVDIRAADIQLSGGIGSIAAGSSNVTLRTSTAAASIGVEDSSRNFKLTNAELSQIATTGTINIGAATNTGGISIGADAALSQGAKNFQFTTAGNIAIGGNDFTTTGNVGLLADNAGNTAAITTGAGRVAANALTATADAGIALNTNATTLSATNTTSGNINILEATGVDIAGLANSAGNGKIQLVTTNGSITTSGAVSANGAGDAIVLAANGNFINNGGANSVQAPNGRWLIYSQATNDPATAPTGNSFGGLPGKNYYGDPFNFATGQFASTPNAGNRFVFGFQPTLAVTPDTKTVTYNGAVQNDTYAITGVRPGDLAADAASGTPTLSSVPSKNAGAYTVTSSQGSLTSDLNYAFSFGSGTLTVAPAPLSIAAVSASKTYDATTSSPAAPTVTGLQGGDTVTGLAERFDSRNAGSRTLSVNGSFVINDGNSGGNYTVTTQTAPGSITAAPLTIAAVSATKIYDASTTSSATPTVTGLQGGDTVTGLAERFDSRNTGSRTLSVNGGFVVNDGNSGGNYTVTTQTASGSISAAPLTIAAVGDSKVYDGTTVSTASPTVSGLQGMDSVSSLSQRFDAANVGNRTLTVNGGFGINDGAGGANYTISTSSAAGSIMPRPITVIADPKQRPAGIANPPLTFTIGGLGLVFGEGLSGGLVTSATVASQVGLYPITQGTLSAGGNYALTFVPGVLTVLPSLASTDSSTLGSTVVRDAFANGFLTFTSVSPMVTIGNSSDPNGPVMVFEDPRFGGWFVCLGAAGIKACSAQFPQ